MTVGFENRRTIFSRIFGRIILGMILLGGAGTAFLYTYVYWNLERQTLSSLEAYIRQRGAREEMIFDLAESNHAVARTEINKRLEKLSTTDPRGRFDSLLERYADGIVRNRSELHDGTRGAGVYVDRNLQIDAEMRRRILTFYDLCDDYGPAWHNQFQDTYITTPENIMVIYWPEVPDWCQEADTTLYMPDEEYVWVADAEHNPERKTVWTGLFFDHVSSLWMVSCETPVYRGGKHIATIGHDIILNELFERVINERLEGTWNVVLRKDGRLIAHPNLIDEIQEKGGYFDIAESGDEYLRSLFETIRTQSDGQGAFVIEHPDGESFLAVADLESIGWYFVTVYPKSLLSEVAWGTMQTAGAITLLTMLAVGFVLYAVLRSFVGNPLAYLTTAAENVETGDYRTSIALDRDDEMGLLAHAFDRMVSGIRDRDGQLAESARELEQRVQERTEKLERLSQLTEAKAADESSRAGLTSQLQGKLTVEEVSQRALTTVAEFIGAPSGALYVVDDDNLLSRTAGYALSPEAESLTSFEFGVGSVGQVAQSRELAVQDHPQGPNGITFGIGTASPPQIVTTPLIANDELVGVIELLMLETIDEEQARWLEDAGEIAATSLRFALESKEREEAEVALRESEQRMTQIIDFLPDAALMIDTEGRVVFWNRKMEEMTGVKAEDMVGKGNHEYALPFFGERRPILVDLALRGISEDDPAYENISSDGEFLSAESSNPMIETEDGGDAHLWGLATPLRDSNREIVGAIECIIDITDRKRAEEELKEAKAIAEDAAQAKGDFLANMSHEIRTPMNAIIGMAHLALRTDLDLKQKDYLDKIQSSGQHLLGIINDILDFSKIEAGKLEIESTDFDLQKTLDVVANLIGDKAAAASLRAHHRRRRRASPGPSRRSAATRTGAHQLRQQCRQVHGRRGDHHSGKSGRENRHRCARPIRGAGHRHRPDTRTEKPPVPVLPAGRHHHHPKIRGNGARSRYLKAACRADGWRSRSRE